MRDPYGCSGDLLAKRLRRDPFAVGPPHPSRCPALQGLMSWCQRSPYPGKLPWSAPLSEVVRGEEEPEDDGTGGGALVAADELTIGGAAS